MFDALRPRRNRPRQADPAWSVAEPAAAPVPPQLPPVLDTPVLPVPVLDGGHLLFFLFEGVLRRPLPLRVREIASLFGLIFLIAMMGIAFKNDLERRWDVIESQVRELTD